MSVVTVKTPEQAENDGYNFAIRLFLTAKTGSEIKHCLEYLHTVSSNKLLNFDRGIRRAITELELHKDE